MTIGRVQLNQMCFLEELMGPQDARKHPRLWVFLFDLEDDAAYGEISLPMAVGDDDRIIAWSKRILLPKIDLSGPELGSRPEDEPLSDVQVRRKLKG